MNKALAAVLCAAALSFCTACTERSVQPDEQSAAPILSGTDGISDTVVSPTETAAEQLLLEDAAEPQTGEAYLCISDDAFRAGYNGSADSPLSYGAVCTEITGNGDYTVGVSADTKGCRYEMNGTPEEDYLCAGLSFAAVVVKDGQTLYPAMALTIREIRVDGEPIAMQALNYTASDDDRDMQADIYNPWAEAFPSDAHAAGGIVSGVFGMYAPVIVNPADFSAWTTVEVDFTVSGLEET